MITPNLKNEREYWNQEILVCGVDEVGRGCLAGPVVAAAVVMPLGHKAILNVRDSKKLTPKMRREVCEKILDKCHDFGIGLVTAAEIDEIGIEKATKKAMVGAIAQLTFGHQVVLIDGNKPLEIDTRQKTIIKGDATVYSISAASVIAKVFRDQILIGLDNAYPEYGFAGHKGYHSKDHVEAIKKYGLTPEHRRYFLRSILNEH
jgi:ribonuclease HII